MNGTELRGAVTLNLGFDLRESTKKKVVICFAIASKERGG
jgi:hypothetical protein